MVKSKASQKKKLIEQQKALHPENMYTIIKKYTICDPMAIEPAKKLFTEESCAYGASVKINDDWLYFRDISKKNVELFREHGYIVELKTKVHNNKKFEVDGIPMDIMCASGTDYDSGCLVQIAYRGKDEEEAFDVKEVIEKKFMSIMKKAGIPLDRVCVSESFKCENVWAKNKTSDFAACGYATNKLVTDGLTE